MDRPEANKNKTEPNEIPFSRFIKNTFRLIPVTLNTSPAQACHSKPRDNFLVPAGDQNCLLNLVPRISYFGIRLKRIPNVCAIYELNFSHITVRQCKSAGGK